LYRRFCFSSKEFQKDAKYISAGYKKYVRKIFFTREFVKNEKYDIFRGIAVFFIF
jgi:hypothetical protein